LAVLVLGSTALARDHSFQQIAAGTALIAGGLILGAIVSLLAGKRHNRNADVTATTSDAHEIDDERVAVG
jgi:hypothetical protein